MPVLWTARILFLMVILTVLSTCVVCTPLTISVAEDLSDAEDYMNWLTDLFQARNYTKPTYEITQIPLDKLSMDSKKCAFDEGRGRYSALNANESFVFLNGANVPTDAISFAGVFDYKDQVEFSMLRGSYPPRSNGLHFL